jgi:hypothetical protein
MSKREDILARLAVVTAGLPGIVMAARNSSPVSDSQCPAIVVYDADEQANENDPRSRPSNAPRRVDMTPEILIKVVGTPESVGTEMNAILDALQTAIVTDAILIELTMDGTIRYMGCATQLAVGRAMSGEMGVLFTFTYRL